MNPELYPSPDSIRDCNTLIVVATQADAVRMNAHPIKAPSTLYVGQLRQLYGIRVGEVIDMVPGDRRDPRFEEWFLQVACRVAP